MVFEPVRVFLHTVIHFELTVVHKRLGNIFPSWSEGSRTSVIQFYITILHDIYITCYSDIWSRCHGDTGNTSNGFLENMLQWYVSVVCDTYYEKEHGVILQLYP